jgi:hypothetical protein
LLSLTHVVKWRAAVTGDQIALSDHLGSEAGQDRQVS